MSDDVFLTRPQADDLATRACRAVGADEASTRSLVDATLSAACHGPPALGFPHFVDYLDSFRQGRINASPAPTVQHAFPPFWNATRTKALRNWALTSPSARLSKQLAVMAYRFSRRETATGRRTWVLRSTAAGEGLVSIAATNSHAMVVATREGKKLAVYGTNPLAFGFPLGDGLPALAIDQASALPHSSTFRAADANRTIPEGWAVDENGAVTTTLTRLSPARCFPRWPQRRKCGVDGGDVVGCLSAAPGPRRAPFSVGQHIAGHRADHHRDAARPSTRRSNWKSKPTNTTPSGSCRVHART
jgi:(2R)-3-sulfolactate dehydrogenase (NADP+)